MALIKTIEMYWKNSLKKLFEFEDTLFEKYEFDTGLSYKKGRCVPPRYWEIDFMSEKKRHALVLELRMLAKDKGWPVEKKDPQTLAVRTNF